MRSGRKHGLSTEQYPVSAYVGSSKNLKDLKIATRKQNFFFAVISTEGHLVGPSQGAFETYRTSSSFENSFVLKPMPPEIRMLPQ